MKLLLKSYVKPHTRVDPSGKVVSISAYTDKRTKKPVAATPATLSTEELVGKIREIQKKATRKGTSKQRQDALAQEARGHVERTMDRLDREGRIPAERMKELRDRLHGIILRWETGRKKEDEEQKFYDKHDIASMSSEEQDSLSQDLIGRGPGVGETFPYGDRHQAIVKKIKTYDNVVGDRTWKSESFTLELTPGLYESLPGTKSAEGKSIGGVGILDLIRQGYKVPKLSKRSAPSAPATTEEQETEYDVVTLKDAPLNPKVKPLVNALNKAGIGTTMSGDAYGEKLVYVDIRPTDMAKLSRDGLPDGWKVTYPHMPHMERDVLGEPMNEGHQRQAPIIEETSSLCRLSRKGGAVTEAEVAAIVQAFQPKQENKPVGRLSGHERRKLDGFRKLIGYAEDHLAQLEAPGGNVGRPAIKGPNGRRLEKPLPKKDIDQMRSDLEYMKREVNELSERERTPKPGEQLSLFKGLTLTFKNMGQQVKAFVLNGMAKAHVKAYQRTSASGQVVQVKDHEDKRAAARAYVRHPRSPSATGGNGLPWPKTKRLQDKHRFRHPGLGGDSPKASKESPNGQQPWKVSRQEWHAQTWAGKVGDGLDSKRSHEVTLRRIQTQLKDLHEGTLDPEKIVGTGRSNPKADAEHELQLQLKDAQKTIDQQGSNLQHISSQHEESVRDAVQSGHDVPDHVLDDYPDLRSDDNELANERPQTAQDPLPAFTPTPHPTSEDETEAWLEAVMKDPDIARAIESNLAGTATDHIHKQADGTYTPARQQLHQAIVSSMLNPKAQAEPGTKPHVVILMGCPGAGKTTTLAPIAKEYGVEFTTVNADDVKAKLPEYNGSNAGLVHEESSDIAEGQLFPQAMQARHHLVMDITGANGKKVKAMVEQFHDHGYEISIAYAHLPAWKAATRVVDRFRKAGRFVPPTYVVNKVDGNPEETYNDLKNDPRVSHWRRYNNDVTKGTEAPLQEQGQRNRGESPNSSQGASLVKAVNRRPVRPHGRATHGQDPAGLPDPIRKAYQLKASLTKSVIYLTDDLASPDLDPCSRGILLAERLRTLEQLQTLTDALARAEC